VLLSILLFLQTTTLRIGNIAPYTKHAHKTKTRTLRRLFQNKKEQFSLEINDVGHRRLAQDRRAD
jgi:hypothetical protein